MDIEDFDLPGEEEEQPGHTRDAVDQGTILAQAAFNQLQGDALNRALDDYSKNIKKTVKNNQSLDVQQGFAAEVHHTESYNIEAAGQGKLNTRAHRTTGNDPVADIEITENGTVTTRAQSKYYGDGKKTSKEISQERYREVEKITPEDQLDSVKSTARRQAARNRDSRPEVADNYQDTANRATDRLKSKDGKISSTPLKRKGKGSSEELVKDAKEKENGPEYHRKKEVRQEFNAMQYRNAAKSGAISGAAFEGTAILLEAMRSDHSLTLEQCQKYAGRIVVSSLKGAGNALLVTSIQHIGQTLIDAAGKQTETTLAKAIGTQLVKGNVASAVAQVSKQLATDLYRFTKGEIDGLQFASSSIGNTVQIAGSSLTYTLGTGLATWIGAAVPASISECAIFGTTLGALGPIAVGTVAAIVFSMAAGAYTSHFSAKGQAIAISDLQSAMEQFKGGEIDFSCYTGKIATMSELEFTWSDICPLSGAIAVVSEYTARKRQLESIQNSIHQQMAQLPEQERVAMHALAAQYNNAISHIDHRYWQARADITHQAQQNIEEMRRNLDRHLEMQYLLFSSQRQKYNEGVALLNLEQRRQQERERRAHTYQHELEKLQTALDSTIVEGNAADTKRQQAMLGIIRSRMHDLIPHKTGWDRACEFLQLY